MAPTFVFGVGCPAWTRATGFADFVAGLGSLLARLQGLCIQMTFELLKDFHYVGAKALLIDRVSLHRDRLQRESTVIVVVSSVTIGMDAKAISVHPTRAVLLESCCPRRATTLTASREFLREFARILHSTRGYSRNNFS
jgi:hypothetical protein